MNRKEWLEKQISELTDISLFAELSEQELIFFNGCMDELKVINLKERGEWREEENSS